MGCFRYLSPLDTVLWHLDADHRLRSPSLVVFLLDKLPLWDRFAAGHEWASRMIPRLRDKPVSCLPGVVPAVWMPDPEFDPARHLRRTALPAAAGMQELLELAASLIAAPFDRSRPPWESILIDSVSWDGRTYAAWIVRYHHCLADGAVLLAWLDALLSRSPEPRWDKPQPPPPRATTRSFLPVPSVGQLGASVFTRARQLNLSEGRRWMRTFTEASASPVPLSPLLSGRSSARRVDVCTVSTKSLMECSRAADVSLGDTLVTGVIDGFRRYHERMGAGLSHLSMVMPELLRAGPARAGNRFGVFRVAAPLTEPDLQALQRAVRDLLCGARQAMSGPAMEALVTSAAGLPPRLLAELGRRLGKTYDLQVSMLGLLSRPLYVSGMQVRRMLGVGPLPGCPAMAFMIPRPAECTVTLTSDPAAVTDGPALVRCIEESFAELAGLADAAVSVTEGAASW